MATSTLSQQQSATKFTVRPLEDASSDLMVANSMAHAIDNFLHEIRSIAKEDGYAPNTEIYENAIHADVMLTELISKIAVATKAVDEAVDAATADGLRRS